MQSKEKKIIRFSMMLLFLALMIVYIVRYQVKWEEIKKIIQQKDSWSLASVTTNKSDDLVIDDTISYEDMWISEITWKADSKTWTKTTNSTSGQKNTTEVTVMIPKTVPNVTGKNSKIRLLSGTSIYYWSISIIEELGIKYQYALTDEKGVRYIYLGTPSYDFASIARALKGDLYTMATEQDLIQNKLFGNKVVFINLPQYKDKQVILLIYLDEGIRLVQMEYWLYHKSKSYLKSLFIEQ